MYARMAITVTFCFTSLYSNAKDISMQGVLGKELRICIDVSQAQERKNYVLHVRPDEFSWNSNRFSRDAQIQLKHTFIQRNDVLTRNANSCVFKKVSGTLTITKSKQEPAIFFESASEARFNKLISTVKAGVKCSLCVHYLTLFNYMCHQDTRYNSRPTRIIVIIDGLDEWAIPEKDDKSCPWGGW